MQRLGLVTLKQSCTRSIALSRWLSLSWQLIAAIELLSLGICIGLWKRARYLEDRARNPLQGGIFGAVLQGNQQ
jgi:hypothetical protein